MFSNLNFFFIDVGIDLTPKRIKVLKDLVLKHEGKILEKEESKFIS